MTWLATGVHYRAVEWFPCAEEILWLQATLLLCMSIREELRDRGVLTPFTYISSCQNQFGGECPSHRRQEWLRPLLSANCNAARLLTPSSRNWIIIQSYRKYKLFLLPSPWCKREDMATFRFLFLVIHFPSPIYFTRLCYKKNGPTRGWFLQTARLIAYTSAHQG